MARYKVAALIGLSEKSLKRWRTAEGTVTEDQRPLAEPSVQPHRLTAAEEAAILAVCNQAEYQSLPPSQIVPLLADRGIYLGSESTFYRVLKRHKQQNHRGRMQAARNVVAPTSFTATGPNQVWTWDISYCPSLVRGQHWYLYLIMDIYSRKIVAWEVHKEESGVLARELVERALLREQCGQNPPVLHSDNGAPMKSYVLKARLAELGMLMSYSRPRVSNDNPFSESLFRTLKYCPEWPKKGFASLTAVREWMLAFEQGYNEQHLHSGINFVTPSDRHRGGDHALLAQRTQVYEEAKRQHPRRWSGSIRNWSVAGPVSLNPCKVKEIERNKVAA